MSHQVNGRRLIGGRWYYGWNIVASCVVIQAVTFGIGFASFTFWVLPWLGAFGTYSIPGFGEIETGHADVQFAVTASLLAMGAISPIAGSILDRVKIRTIVLIGAALFVTALLLVSIATSLVQIVLIYTLVLAPSLVLAGPLAMATLTARWFRGRRGLALGISSVGTSLGAILFPPVVTALIATEGGWRDAHVALALISGLILIPLVWLVVRGSPEELGIEPEPESEQSQQLAAHFSGRAWTAASILRERTLWITIAGFLPLNVMLVGVQNNLGPFAADLSIDAQDAAYLISALGGAMLFGKLAFGALSDQIDHRFLFWFATLLFAGSFGLMLNTPNYASLLLACSMLGFGMGANMPITGAIVASRFGPQAFGRVTGILYMFLTLSAFGPVIAGGLRDSTGNYESTFQLFLICLVPAALAMAFLPRVRKVSAANNPR